MQALGIVVSRAGDENVILRGAKVCSGWVLHADICRANHAPALLVDGDNGLIGAGGKGAQFVRQLTGKLVIRDIAGK